MLCGWGDSDGFKRSFRFAARGPGNREDHSGEESAAFAFGGHLGSGEVAEGTCAEDRGSPEAEKQVLDFLLERARYILRERRGFAYDEINAAFAAGADDLVDAVSAWRR